jgi:hypothetical protein
MILNGTKGRESSPSGAARFFLKEVHQFDVECFRQVPQRNHGRVTLPGLGRVGSVSVSVPLLDQAIEGRLVPRSVQIGNRLVDMRLETGQLPECTTGRRTHEGEASASQSGEDADESRATRFVAEWPHPLAGTTLPEISWDSLSAHFTSSIRRQLFCRALTSN